MKLDKYQKEDLESLVKHPGWRIVKLIQEEDNTNLGKSLLNIDLQNDDALKVLRDIQIVTKARNDFVKDIESKSLKVIGNEIKLS